MAATPPAADIIKRLNEFQPSFIDLLGGSVVAVDTERQACTFQFCVPLDYCHSGDVVQGGFVTALLDAAMSHAVFGCEPDVERLSTLEISTRYENVTRGASPITVTGWVRKLTRSVAFLEADIRDQQGATLATAQSVAKISRAAT